MISRRQLLALTLVAGLMAPSCKKTSPKQGRSDEVRNGPVQVAVIPKGTDNEYWKAVEGGAYAAGKDSDVEMIWKGPHKEDDLQAQIEIVQGFIAQKVAGIVLAPINDHALLNAVKNAQRAGIPVVIVDSALQGNAYVSFVATDNYAAGKMAGENLAKRIDGRGNVVLLRHQQGSASTSARERGFMDTMAKHPDIRVVSSDKHGGATVESSFAVSEALLAAQKQASKEIAGVFTPSEATTLGMLRALDKSGLAGKTRFVGFDGCEKITHAIRSGQLDATVLQRPTQMGYMGVKIMAKHLRGEPVDARVDTGAVLATRENLDTPEIKALLEPAALRSK